MFGKEFAWSEEKNRALIKEQSSCFEDVITAIGSGCLLDIIIHPNSEKYPEQLVFIVAIKDYAYLIPFIESETTIFLKAIISSRKAVKKYLNR